MKNFYEILEINQNASQEIIEKAYKVLVKKYHPDLQTSQEDKSKCEEKIKQINEAYDIISNPDLRAEYDNKLKEEYNERLRYEEEQKEKSIKQKYQESKSSMTQDPIGVKQPNNGESQRQQSIRERAERERQYKEVINKAYYDAYIQDLKNRGYKIKYKKTLNDYLHSLVALLITIGIIFIILQLPFVKNYLNELYQKNEIFHFIADFFANLFN